MFLHIGNGETVKTRNIIGIFDFDTATMSEQTRVFLRRAEQAGSLQDAAKGEIPRSFVLTDEGKAKKENAPLFKLHLSQISTYALKTRTKNPPIHEEE